MTGFEDGLDGNWESLTVFQAGAADKP